MTTDQILIVLILAGAMAAFAVRHWRTEVVAVAALATATLIGLVDVNAVFEGFSNPAVITVVEILMLAQLLARSGVVDYFARPVLANINTERQLVIFISVVGAALSILMNNIGALAIMLPIAYSGCRLLDISPRRVLMPLSFATLLGGMCSLIGTPANLVVSSARADAIGAPMDFFAYAIVGVPAAIAGLVWIGTFGAAPKSADAKGDEAKPGDAEGPDDIVFELRLSERSSWPGKQLEEVERDEGVRILNVIRDDQFVFARRGAIKLFVDDLVVLAAPHELFDGLFDAGEIVQGFDSKTFLQEAVVTPSSVLLGSTIGAVIPFEIHDVRAVGLRGAHVRAEGRFEDIKLSVGDVIFLAGDRLNIAASLENTGCLALAPRRKRAGGAITPLAAIALLGGVVLSAAQITPPEIAFGLALAVMAVAGAASLPELMRRLDWRVIIMLAALIPLAGAFENTGAAAQIVQPVLFIARSNEVLLIASIWGMSTLITPFLNNVATAAIMAPIAMAAAGISGASPDALLLAVAAGASTDFLTPFGHHNNTVVMGAAGYELRDFLTRGAPLTLIVGCVVIVTLSIAY